MSITPLAIAKAVAEGITDAPITVIMIDLKTLPAEPSTAPDAPGVGIKPTAVMANDVPAKTIKNSPIPTGTSSDKRIKKEEEYKNAKDSIFERSANAKVPLWCIKSLKDACTFSK